MVGNFSGRLPQPQGIFAESSALKRSCAIFRETLNTGSVDMI